ncbi:MAG: S41 family peptidase [Gemmatimonadetes bacterium]|nr:S41 family peptidase [Gemmatimonadota bacterium]
MTNSTSAGFSIAVTLLSAAACAAPGERLETATAPPPLAAAAVDPGCAVDWDSTYTIVSRDYAGFAGKTAGPERAAAFAAVTDRVRAELRSAADAEACTAALQRWIAFFGDRHLQLWQPGAPAPQPAGPAPAPAQEPRLSVAFLDDSTALLTLPDFGQRWKGAIDSLVAAHRERLLATPYLVIDVRGNGGGWTASYASVLPLLYTDPIHVDGIEGWASEGNVAEARRMVESPDTPEQLKAQIRPMLGLLEANRGRFVRFAGDDTVTFDTVHPLPRAVAIVADRRCASTCEQFLLDARQSRKVTVFASENTRGMLDYGNLRTVRLPSGARRLAVPTTRSLRLPENPMDLVGIAPGVRIPPGETDPVRFAARHLRSHGGAGHAAP